MTDREKAFDVAYKNLGGLLINDSTWWIKTVKEYLTQGLQFIRSYSPGMPDINANIVSNDVVNATAMLHESKFYIGITSGLCHLIWNIFNKMYASKTLFTNVGQPEIEKDELQLIDYGLVNGNITFSGYSEVIPQDYTRNVAVRICASMTLQFILFHEVGHILNGHVGYKSNLKNELVDELAAMAKNSNFDPLTSQTLEMDADAYAAKMCYEFARRNIENYERLSADMQPFFKNLEEFYSYWTLSVYVFFRVFWMGNVEPDANLKSTHPPPHMRVRMIVYNLARMFVPIKLPDFWPISTAIFYAQVEAERAFCEVTTVENLAVKYFTNQLQAIEYITAIMSNWDNVHDNLLPFAFQEIPKTYRV